MPEEKSLLTPEVEDGAAAPVVPPKDAPVAEESEAEKPEAGAPEEYGDFKLPEGFTADQALIDKFKPLAKEAGLSQESAQKLVDLYAEAIQSTTQRGVQEWESQTKEWRAEAEKDADLMKHIDGARRVLAFADPNHELLDYLEATGMGNFPPLLRALARLGQKFSEASLVTGKVAPAETGPPKSLAERIYPAKTS